jgi:aconitate hydratase
MGKSLTYKLLEAHDADTSVAPGEEIAVKIDQTLTQDATGTLVMLYLDAMGLNRTKAETSVQYVDHNLIQADFKNPDDHLFLESACRKFGCYFSPPGNGVSHPVHMQRFGKPGKTLLGSDSHTPAAGSIGMLAFGAGGIEVAAAIAGEPFYVPTPKVWNVRLVNQLPDWVSAKDVILELLRRHDVDGGLGYVIEYSGPGLESLSAMDRHVIANMGTELGATTSIFPSDKETRRFLKSEGREEDWQELAADEDANYDREEEVDLSKLVPLIAKPSSPGNVVTVEEIAGEEIYQAYVGSSANPGYRDFAMAARMLEGKSVADGVSLDVNPTSRQLLALLIEDKSLEALIAGGARLHQAGCNGCIGMGQAPASGRKSLRTVPRNFPGRSGTREDEVYLCSPETATASALEGVITDPRSLGMDYPDIPVPDLSTANISLLEEPPAPEKAKKVDLVKGPNIKSLPKLKKLPDRLELPILLKVGDDITTDEIMPAGTRVLPFRSNIPKISEFVFDVVDEDYVERTSGQDAHAVIAGKNYGQGSSREHAALAPRYLGLRAVVAKSFARIHRQNLINFGILPLTYEESDDYESLESGQTLVIEDAVDQLSDGPTLTAHIAESDREMTLRHDMSARQRKLVVDGGLINVLGQ